MQERLQKRLARAGLGSRRELEEWIRQGRIQVNGETAILGTKVEETDVIMVDGKPLELTPTEEQTHRVIIYHKPEGEISTRRDPEGRKTVFTQLPRLQDQRWVGVGRLDINTTGLLLFTTDGELANRLMHPSSGIDREYLVRIRGEVNEAMLERLKAGVVLEDGEASFNDIVPGRNEGSHSWYYVTIMEGRKREVRRLWESQGINVSRLKRVRFGPVFMPSTLLKGQWQYLEQTDANQIYEAAGLQPCKVETAEPPRRKTMADKKAAIKRASNKKATWGRRP